MITRARAMAAVLVVAIAGWPRAAAADFTSDLAAAMTPYYGALVASAVGDAESTQRNLVLFAVRWKRVAGGRATAPDPIANDPDWPAMVVKIDQYVARALELVRARSLHDAHREIEGIRLALRAMRVRHGLETLDDRLTAYHESMERLVARASLYNEIILADSDYAELSRDLARADMLWARVDAEAGAIGNDRDWTSAAARGTDTRRELARLIAARDDAAIMGAAGAMKAAYLDLLLVMARGTR